MKIYKVIGFVNKDITRGCNKGRTEQVFHKTEIIIDNLETSKEIYKSIRNEVSTYCYAGYHGKTFLFIPHKFDNGTLANWPDNDKYIEEYDSDIE